MKCSVCDNYVHHKWIFCTNCGVSLRDIPGVEEVRLCKDCNVKISKIRTRCFKCAKKRSIELEKIHRKKRTQEESSVPYCDDPVTDVIHHFKQDDCGVREEILIKLERMEFNRSRDESIFFSAGRKFQDIYLSMR